MTLANDVVRTRSNLPAVAAAVADTAERMSLADAARVYAETPKDVNYAVGEYLKAGLDLVKQVKEGQSAGVIAEPGDNPIVRNSDNQLVTLEELGVKRRRLSEMRALRDAGLTAEQVDAFAQRETLDDRIFRISRLEREVRDRRAEEQREAARDVLVDGVDLRHGDFRDVLADLHDVDAIVTDPPYGAEHLPLLADLATVADRILAPDGVLAVLFGQTHLPTAYHYLSVGRPYRWTMAYLAPGRRRRGAVDPRPDRRIADP